MLENKPIRSVRGVDLQTILRVPIELEESRITKRRLLYETLAKIARKPPSKHIPVPEGLEGSYRMCVFIERYDKNYS